MANVIGIWFMGHINISIKNCGGDDYTKSLPKNFFDQTVTAFSNQQPKIFSY